MTSNLPNSSAGKAAVPIPADYNSVLENLKQHIQAERVRAQLAVNSAMVLLYWDIGHVILQRQQDSGWGAKIIDHLSRDLSASFPEMQGFSPRNLKYMRKFAEAWPDRAIVQEALAQIPWYHNLALLEKCQERNIRLWYAAKAAEHGWSRNVLVVQIESALHKRQGSAINNFRQTLPPPDSDMAVKAFKDPYIFDFLGTASLHKEREVEQNLMDHMQRFLLELGAGFAFIGRQVPLVVGDKDFRLDLLFYHLKLRCFVVVELKAGPFDPGYVGQLNLYLSAVDDQLRHSEDRPTIGLLLCKSKTRLVVEYALRGMTSPMGIAQWETTLTDQLPDELEGSLPSIKDIEGELAQEVGE